MFSIPCLLNKKYIIQIYIIVFVVIVLRRPDIIFNAQPWAEDGLWMASVYTEGFWSSLLAPQNGYFQTISRLAYGLGLLWGFENAPLIANVTAISIRCLFILFVLSDRMKFIDIEYRILASCYFLLMPNLSEGYVNITNVHWYLAMYMFAIVLAEKPQGRLWKAHDITLFFIGGLSGPFIIFIAVCQAIKKVSQYGSPLKAIKQFDIYDAIIGGCMLIQTCTILLTSSSDRSPAPLGASISLLANIVSYRIIAGTFLSNDTIRILGQQPFYDILLTGVLFGTLLLLFLYQGWRVRSSIIFFLLILGCSLAKPMMSIDQPQWPLFLVAGLGERYFFTTNFAFFCMLLLLISFIRRGKYIAITLFVCMIPLFASYFAIQPLVDVGYKEHITRFESTSSVGSVSIPINPPGWNMVLKKK